MELLSQVKDELTTYDLLKKGEKVIIGLSGGVDSVALLLLLNSLADELGISVHPMHVHHHLRDEATKDQQYCEVLCKELKLNLKVVHVDVKAYCERHKRSLEDGARQLRYKAFEDYYSALKADKIAVAHHKEDQAETILHRLIRGSGSLGLTGMQRINGYIIRPLLGVSKKMLVDYVEALGRDFVYDTSNDNQSFTRNRIRHELIPLLAQYNENIVDTIVRTGGILTEDESCLRDMAKKVFDQVKIKGDDTKLKYQELNTQPVSIQKRVIRMAISQVKGDLENIESAHVNRILELMNLQSGKQVPVVEGLVVKKEYDSLVFTSKKNGKKNSLIEPIFLDSLPITRYIQNANMTMSVRVLTKSEYKGLTNYKDSFKKDANLYTKWFDYDKIEANLVLRTRIPGDRITVGVNGDSKLLKKYFTDEKIPLSLRDHVPLLAIGQDVLWILEYRSSEGYRLSETTKNVLEVKLIKEDENGKN